MTERSTIACTVGFFEVVTRQDVAGGWFTEVLDGAGRLAWFDGACHGCEADALEAGQAWAAAQHGLTLGEWLCSFG